MNILLNNFFNPIWLLIVMFSSGLIFSFIHPHLRIFQIVSVFFTIGGICLYYIKIDPYFFEDYLSYVSWMQNADKVAETHIDLLFAKVMSILGAIGTGEFIFQTFVLLYFITFIVVLSRALYFNIAVFCAIICINPRVIEFLFNSTRSSLSLLALALVVIFAFRNRKIKSVILLIVSLLMHFYIALIGVLGFFVAAFIRERILISVFIVTVVTYLVGVSLVTKLDFIIEQIIYFINIERFGAIDEYYFMDHEINTIGVLSNIFFIGFPACFAYYLSRHCPFSAKLTQISLALLVIMFSMAHTFPVVLRIGLLSILLSAVVISKKINIQNRYHAIVYFAYTFFGLVVVVSKANLISFLI